MLPSSGEWLPEGFDRGAGADAAQRARQSEPEENADGGGARDGTLFGMTRSGLLGIGILLIVVGLIAFVGGTLYMVSGPPMPGFTGNFQQDQAASDAWFQESAAHGATGFGVVAIGVVLFGIGAFMARFGLIRPVSSYVATEASPAIETAAEAIGKGLREAGAGLPSASPATTVVKVKCKNCGYLDSEDATYCSKCGNAL